MTDKHKARTIRETRNRIRKLRRLGLHRYADQWVAFLHKYVAEGAND